MFPLMQAICRIILNLCVFFYFSLIFLLGIIAKISTIIMVSLNSRQWCERMNTKKENIQRERSGVGRPKRKELASMKSILIGPPPITFGSCAHGYGHLHSCIICIFTKPFLSHFYSNAPMHTKVQSFPWLHSFPS